MKEIITDPWELTPQLTTEMLLNNGVMSKGTVTSISVETTRETDLSTTASLNLTYSPDAPEDLPNNLFFKAAGQQNPESNAEIQFYRHVGSLIQNGIILPCFASDYSEASGTYYILLEDISETHVINPRLDKVDWHRSAYDPSVAQQLVDGFAHIHSLFWGDTGLGSTMGIRKISEVYPDLLVARILEGKNLTLTHNDPHTANIIPPIDPKKDRIAVLDWVNYGQWVGVHDLANHIPMYWHRTVRNAMEKDLLHRYHSQLCDRGIAGYDWEQCWYDYRLGVVGQVNRRIKHATFDSAVGLEICDNCLNAFEDIECEELIYA